MAVALGKPASGASFGKGLGRGRSFGGGSIEIYGLDELETKLGGLQRAARLLDGYTAEVTSDSPYIDYVTQGTRAHVIEARNVLALNWPGARHPVRRVLHPGTQPNPFVEEAIAARSAELDARVLGGIEQAFDQGDERHAQQAMQLAANVLLGEVRQRAPRRTGALAGSLRTQFRRG